MLFYYIHYCCGLSTSAKFGRNHDYPVILGDLGLENIALLRTTRNNLRAALKVNWLLKITILSWQTYFIFLLHQGLKCNVSVSN